MSVRAQLDQQKFARWWPQRRLMKRVAMRRKRVKVPPTWPLIRAKHRALAWRIANGYELPF